MNPSFVRRPRSWIAIGIEELRLVLMTRSLFLIPLIMFGAGLSNEPFRNMAGKLPLLFFFPLILGRGGRHSLDEALPVSRATHEALRALCGAVPLVAVLTGLIWMRLLEGNWYQVVVFGENAALYPRWIPAAFVLAGLSFYFAGAAVRITSAKPGRTMAVALMVGVAAAAFGAPLPATLGNPQDLRLMSRWDVLSAHLALFALSLGSLVAAAFWTHGPIRASWRLPQIVPPRNRDGFASLRSEWRSGPDRQPFVLRVALRQWRLQTPRMLWVLGTIVALACLGMSRAETVDGATSPAFLEVGDPFSGVIMIALCWPIAVWLNEHKGPEWDYAHAGGMLSSRLIHAATGLVWLQIAVGLMIGGAVAGAFAAGTLSSITDVPAVVWLGVPLAALTFYLLGTIMTALTGHPVTGGIVGLIALFPVLFITRFVEMSLLGQPWSALFSPEAPLPPFSPIQTVTPVVSMGPYEWSPVTALFWISVFAALTIAVMYNRIWREWYGRWITMRDWAALGRRVLAR